MPRLVPGIQDTSGKLPIPKAPRTQMIGFLGPKYYNINCTWAPKPYDLGPRITQRVSPCGFLGRHGKHGLGFMTRKPYAVAITFGWPAAKRQNCTPRIPSPLDYLVVSVDERHQHIIIKKSTLFLGNPPHLAFPLT